MQSQQKCSGYTNKDDTFKPSVILRTHFIVLYRQLIQRSQKQSWNHYTVFINIHKKWRWGTEYWRMSRYLAASNTDPFSWYFTQQPLCTPSWITLATEMRKRSSVLLTWRNKNKVWEDEKGPVAESLSNHAWQDEITCRTRSTSADS